MELRCGESLSTFAFKCKLRRYRQAVLGAARGAEIDAHTVVWGRVG